MSGSRWPVALAVAGSDPSGGAGLQADLKTFAAMEVYGSAAVTAVTVQDTRGVRDVHLVPPAIVAAQMEAVLDDLPVAAVKTGMLGGPGQLAAVVEVLERQRGVSLVVDPVMVSTSGDTLLAPEAQADLVHRLLPLASLITPNLAEARSLAGMPVAPPLELGEHLLRSGARAVLITGGCGQGEAVEDLLFSAAGRRTYRHRRVETTATHGTGCTLSSAVAAGLAWGRPLEDAVERAIAFVQRALETAWPLGRGHGPVHHMHRWWPEK